MPDLFLGQLVAEEDDVADALLAQLSAPLMVAIEDHVPKSKPAEHPVLRYSIEKRTIVNVAEPFKILTPCP